MVQQPERSKSERFLVSGASQGKVFGGLEIRQIVAEEAHDKMYRAAVLMEIDFAAKKVLRKLTIDREEIGHHIPGYATNFTVPTRRANRLFLPSHASIWEIDLERFEVVRRVSHRLLNDVHHVLVCEDRTYVVSTGIDRVLVGDGLDRLDAARIVDCLEGLVPLSDDIDYRTCSTKPHKCHPNHISLCGGTPWVTRARQMDVARLDQPDQRVGLADAMVHDGVVFDGLTYFTAVNGQVIAADLEKMERVESMRLPSGRFKQATGWCRGLLVTRDHFYVGFSVLRKTKHAENVQWAKAHLLGGLPPMPTRIEKIDRRSGELVDRFDFKTEDLSAIFWLAPA